MTLACGSQTPDALDAGDTLDAMPADGGLSFGDAATLDASDASCDPPELLIVLDRSDSMSGSPDGADGGASKWSLAVDALDTITKPPIDATLRFGLELLPDQACVKGPSGACGYGTVAFPTALDNGNAIASTLATTSLLNGTPIGGAMQTATTTLTATAVSGRAQNVVLVTDGRDTCSALDGVQNVQALAKASIHTYVVGFDGATDPAYLNDLACAGLTAANFKASCTLKSGGYVASVTKSTHVFFDATDGAALQTALATIAGGTCCGCEIPK